MVTTSTLRTVDELGRVVLPYNLRTMLGIGAKDSVEIFVEDDCIILKRTSSPTGEERVFGTAPGSTCVRFLEGIWPALCE